MTMMMVLMVVITMANRSVKFSFPNLQLVYYYYVYKLEKVRKQFSNFQNGISFLRKLTRVELGVLKVS